MPEIEQAELDRHRQLERIARTIMGNPNAAKKFEEAYKLADPTAPTPRLDEERARTEPLTELQAEIKALRTEREADKAEREQREKLGQLSAQIEAGKSALRRAGWTAEGLQNLDKFMEERGLIDVEVAASAYERMHPPATVATPSGSGAWNFMDGIGDAEADLKKLVETKGESGALLDKMIRSGLDDVRGRR